jgi:hypothetical protein
MPLSLPSPKSHSRLTTQINISIVQMCVASSILTPSTQPSPSVSTSALRQVGRKKMPANARKSLGSNMTSHSISKNPSTFGALLRPYSCLRGVDLILSLHTHTTQTGRQRVKRPQIFLERREEIPSLKGKRFWLHPPSFAYLTLPTWYYEPTSIQIRASRTCK